MPTLWKTIRVFISSTFRDIQTERDWLERFVFPHLQEELLKFRIQQVSRAVENGGAHWLTA